MVYTTPYTIIALFKRTCAGSGNDECGDLVILERAELHATGFQMIHSKYNIMYRYKVVILYSYVIFHLNYTAAPQVVLLRIQAQKRSKRTLFCCPPFVKTSSLHDRYSYRMVTISISTSDYIIAVNRFIYKQM